MTHRHEAGLSTQKVAVLRRLQSLVHTSWPSSAKQKMLSCSMYQRNLFTNPANPDRGRELINGTNFRHAVEFSRSGRTPSQPFRAVRGQPAKRYSGQSSPGQTPGTARLPTWSPLTGSMLVLGGASRLGDVRCRLPRRAPSLRTRRTLVSRIRRSQIPSADAQDARIRWGQRLARARRSVDHARGRGDVCELAHRRRGVDRRLSRRRAGRPCACPTASTRPTSVGARQVVAARRRPRSPSTRTAPASMSRRAALVLAASPAATSSGRQVHRVAVGQRRAPARRSATSPRWKTASKRSSAARAASARGRASTTARAIRRLARFAAAPPAATSASSASTSRGCRPCTAGRTGRPPSPGCSSACRTARPPAR